MWLLIICFDSAKFFLSFCFLASDFDGSHNANVFICSIDRSDNKLYFCLRCYSRSLEWCDHESCSCVVRYMKFYLIYAFQMLTPVIFATSKKRRMISQSPQFLLRPSCIFTSISGANTIIIEFHSYWIKKIGYS